VLYYPYFQEQLPPRIGGEHAPFEGGKGGEKEIEKGRKETEKRGKGDQKRGRVSVFISGEQ
jgi:hypothetical protein